MSAARTLGRGGTQGQRLARGAMSGPRRILILSASVGGGHLRAAEAVEAACRRRDPSAVVRHVDTLTLTPGAFRRVYAKGYFDLVNHAPDLLGALYARSDRPPRGRSGERLRLAVERLNTRPLVALLDDFAPDVVCHTHFLPAEILGHRRRRRGFRAPQAVVVTDYDVHRFWVSGSPDLYCVAREDGRIQLEALGVATERIRVTGIPVVPAFAELPDRAALRLEHGVDANQPVLLVLCGGFGLGPVEALVGALWGHVRGVQMIVIAGRNDPLRRRLEAAARRAEVPTRVLGFTSEMHEWMGLADVAVTKPGGLTTSEALACGLPLVVANPIPGQETRNAAMLYEEGAAISGENLLTVGPRVARLLASPERLAAMRASALRLGRPHAAMAVAEALDRLG
jgi:processive 1,2-diacylglycerol beta-glucosyltransferase